MKMANNETDGVKILAEGSNPKILAAVEDYARKLDEEIRERPLHWAPCYEALDAEGKDTGAFSDDAVQWSVCGMLLTKMSSRPYGADTIIARTMAQRLLGLIAYRMLNYEDPERVSEFAADNRTLLEAGGSHCNIHRIEHETGLVGAQDIADIFRRKMPQIQEAVSDIDLSREYGR